MKDTIRKAFSEKDWQVNSTLIVRSPGRINIIGEHTDYNNGYVLPAAIDKAAYIGISLTGDDTIQLFAKDLNESFSTTIHDIHPNDDQSWVNYILGPIAQLKKKGIPLKGFNAILSSDLPIGAGLSSSAAVECASLFGMNELLGSGLDKISMIKMAQAAEHEFAGVHCGIMDMFASMMGKKDHVIKLDCRSLDYEYVPFDLEDYTIILFNTNVKHSLASSEYNTRRQECNQAVEWINEYQPNVHSLRDVTETMLDEYVRPKNELIDMRGRFIVREINRLLEGCEDLKKHNLPSLGKKLYATHDGLSKQYAVSCKELDWLAEFAKKQDAVIGARMMGGGFGGCTINLVKNKMVDDLIESITPAYAEAMHLSLSNYRVSIEDGTSIV